MKIFAVLALAFALAPAFVCSTANAQAPPAPSTAPPDPRAIVEDARIAELLKATSGAKEIDEKTARAFGPLIFQDGFLTVNERDLIVKLYNNTSVLTIVAPGGESFEVPVLSGQARAFLSLMTPPDLGRLWLRGPAQMKQLVDITVLDPLVTSRVVLYIRTRLALSWMDSTIANGYKPLRDNLSAAVRQLQQTDADTERRGRLIIFDAVRQLNRASSNPIPTYLYDYLGQN
jgi:hypothetical protein